MARSELRDPLDKFRWIVQIDDFSRSGFVACSTPSYKINTTTYAEGGSHLNPRQITDSIEYTPVTLTRGVTSDTSFNKWATGQFDIVQNNRNNGFFSVSDVNTDSIEGFLGTVGDFALNAISPSNVQTNNPGLQYRRDVKIKHVNRAGQTVAIYTLFDAYPIEYKPASDFEANDDEGFSIETLILAYEGFDVRYTGIAGALTNLAANQLF